MLFLTSNTQHLTPAFMNQATKKTLAYIAIALTFGISMGISLGIATGNMLLWVIVGVGFSVVVGWVLGSSGDR